MDSPPPPPRRRRHDVGTATEARSSTDCDGAGAGASPIRRYGEREAGGTAGSVSACHTCVTPAAEREGAEALDTPAKTAGSFLVRRLLSSGGSGARSCGMSAQGTTLWKACRRGGGSGTLQNNGRGG